MEGGQKALIAILVLCGGAGLTGYNLAPRTTPTKDLASTSLVPTPVKPVAVTFEREPAPDVWKRRVTTDKMTGKSQAKLLMRQDDGSGVVAETEAACEPIGKGHAVTFTTLIIDRDGNPTIGIRGRYSDGKGVKIRYRQNDVIRESRIPNSNYSNQFVTFMAVDDGAVEFIKASPYGVNLYVAGLEGGLLYTGRYSQIQTVKAEYQTDRGPIVVSIDVSTPTIQQLYAECFR